jgi:hypothetical protein
MSNAIRDDNHVPVKLGVWCVDGVTKIPIAINPANKGIMIDTVSTISYTPTSVNPEDENFVDVMLAQGSDELWYPVNVNVSGGILVEQ